MLDLTTVKNARNHSASKGDKKDERKPTLIDCRKAGNGDRKIKTLWYFRSCSSFFFDEKHLGQKFSTVKNVCLSTLDLAFCIDNVIQLIKINVLTILTNQHLQHVY